MNVIGCSGAYSSDLSERFHTSSTFTVQSRQIARSSLSFKSSFSPPYPAVETLSQQHLPHTHIVLLRTYERLTPTTAPAPPSDPRLPCSLSLVSCDHHAFAIEK